jgi:hypothetical protein
MTIELSEEEVKEICDALECWREENGSSMEGEWLRRVLAIRNRLGSTINIKAYDYGD